MRFCQSFMIELSRHVGQDVDVPAGDIGVGAREISFLFGQYKKLQNRFTGVLTGKGIEFGGSLIRTEATGYGLIYFTEEILNHHSESLKGKTCLLSGSGNVAQYAVEKLIEKGAKVLTMSDSRGMVYFENGITLEVLAEIKELKLARKSLAELKSNGLTYHEGKEPWGVKADFAFPCATQNELDLEEIKTLIDNGCRGVFEGANMPCTNKAVDYINEKEL